MAFLNYIHCILCYQMREMNERNYRKNRFFLKIDRIKWHPWFQSFNFCSRSTVSRHSQFYSVLIFVFLHFLADSLLSPFKMNELLISENTVIVAISLLLCSSSFWTQNKKTKSYCFFRVTWFQTKEIGSTSTIFFSILSLSQLSQSIILKNKTSTATARRPFIHPYIYFFKISACVSSKSYPHSQL